MFYFIHCTLWAYPSVTAQKTVVAEFLFYTSFGRRLTSPIMQGGESQTAPKRCWYKAWPTWTKGYTMTCRNKRLYHCTVTYMNKRLHHGLQEQKVISLYRDLHERKVTPCPAGTEGYIIIPWPTWTKGYTMACMNTRLYHDLHEQKVYIYSPCHDQF